MTTKRCDACGREIGPIDGHGAWTINLRFLSNWRPRAHEVTLDLCSGCGHQAARLLGFCYDTGTILSTARGEQIDGVKVHGPHGGGIEDIAFHGIDGAHDIRWHAERPGVPLAANMVREEAPWMRAQGYEDSFWRKNARELKEADVRRMIAEGADDEEIAVRLYGFPDPSKSRSDGAREYRERLMEERKS